MIKVILLCIGFLFFPQLVTAADVTLAWDANIEQDLKGYIIYYGTASGNYTQSVNVGNVTQYTLTDLEEGVEYFFAATAYDISNNESAYSEELVYTVPKKTDHPPIAPFNIYIKSVKITINVIPK